MQEDPELKSLGEKIQNLKNKHSEEQISDTSNTDSENMRNGLRAGTELVVAILAGAFIGYHLDNFFQTKPLFLLALLVLGIITGFVNVWRVSEGLGTTVGIGKALELKKKRTQKTERDKRGVRSD